MLCHFSRLIVAVAALLALGACSRPPPPDYDRLHVILMRDLFRALEEEDFELAIRKLDRLAEVKDDAPNVDTLKRVQIDNIAIAQANERIQHGDYQGARELLRGNLLKYGRSQQLNQALQVAEALLVVRNYVQEGPRESARATAVAVASLPDPELLAEVQEFYEPWYERQKEHAAAMLREEKEKLIVQTIEALDHAAVHGSDTMPDLVRRLQALAPGNAIVTAARETETSAAVARALSQEKDPISREVGLFIVVYRGAANKELLKQAAGAPAVSLSGRYLKAHALLLEGRTIAGLAALRELQAMAPESDYAPLFEALPPGGNARRQISVPALLEAVRSLNQP